jgi:hypothetical protein
VDSIALQVNLGPNSWPGCGFVQFNRKVAASDVARPARFQTRWKNSGRPPGRASIRSRVRTMVEILQTPRSRA